MRSETNKHHELDCRCNQSKHKIDRYIHTYSSIVAVSDTGVRNCGVIVVAHDDDGVLHSVAC